MRSSEWFRVCCLLSGAVTWERSRSLQLRCPDSSRRSRSGAVVVTLLHSSFFGMELMMTKREILEIVVSLCFCHFKVKHAVSGRISTRRIIRSFAPHFSHHLDINLAF